MQLEHNQTVKNTQNIEEVSSNHDDLFLSAIIVNIIIKVAKIFEISSVDEFSIMETLHYAIMKNAEALEETLDEKVITVFVLNIIRISDKYNKAGSTMSQAKLESFLPGLGVTADELNKHELDVFKSHDLKVLESVTVDLIFDLMSSLLAEQENKPFLFEIAMDVLRGVYINAVEIYEEFTQGRDADVAIELKQNKPLLASAVFMVLLKLLNVSDRVHNQTFDLTAERLDHPQAAAMLNQLAAIIFKIVLAQ